MYTVHSTLYTVHLYCTMYSTTVKVYSIHSTQCRCTEPVLFLLLQGLRGLMGVVGTERLDGQASFLFVALAPHIINDDSSACRKAVAATLSSLLKTVR